MQELVVRKTIKIKTAPENVWDALTTPEITRQYMFDSDVISDWRTGSSIAYKEKETVHVRGTIMDIVPGKLLQFTCYGPSSGLADVPSNYSRVTYELSSEDEHTALSVTQDQFDGDEKRFNDSDKGWDFVLPLLKTLLEHQK